MRDREPAGLARLREVHRTLRAQHEGRHRAGAPLPLIDDLVEDHADR